MYITCIYIYTRYIIGWASVGWRRCHITRLSLGELDSQGAVFFWIFFLPVTAAVAVELDHFCAGEPSLRARETIVSRKCVYGEAPSRQLLIATYQVQSIPMAVSGNGHIPRKQLNSFEAVIHGEAAS